MLNHYKYYNKFLKIIDSNKKYIMYLYNIMKEKCITKMYLSKRNFNFLRGENDCSNTNRNIPLLDNNTYRNINGNSGPPKTEHKKQCCC